MTELRRQMDDDMVVRGMAKRTRKAYLAAVTGLAKYYRRSPDQISDEEVPAYLLHLIRDRHRSWNTCHIVVHGLRFLYHTTLKRDRTTFSIPPMRQPGKLPVILSPEDVQRVIAPTPNLKYRTMLLTTYAAGLRLNEVSHLRIPDIDAARMTIRVALGGCWGDVSGVACCVCSDAGGSLVSLIDGRPARGGTSRARGSR